MERRQPKIKLNGQMIPRFIDNHSEESLKERLAWLQNKIGQDLSIFKSYIHDPKMFARSIENCIGVSHFPTGVAGPLLVNGRHARGTFYVPMVTNEGSLIEAYHRGAFIATLAGGVSSVVCKDAVHLTPSFVFKNLHESIKFITWVRENEDRIKETANNTTRHGSLIRINPILIGRRVYLNMLYRTGDASGLNMINIASDAACKMIVSETNAERYFLRSNLSSDKKPSFFNFISGYGKEVVTEITLSNSLIKRFLRTTSKDIFDCWYQGCLATFQAGMLGPNGQLANGLSAMYMAFGQDIAQIVNAATGMLSMEVLDNQDLKVHCKFPQLIVATVGGGTSLPFAKTCLEMVGCAGEGKSLKLAEIIAAMATVGEISLMGAVAAGEFVNAALTVRVREKLAAQIRKGSVMPND